jgi:uncharacterized repeat protein (TIGR01451 family)
MKYLNERVFLNWKFRFLIFVGIALTFSNFAMGQYDPLTNITDNDFAQYNPAIYGDYIVYSGFREQGLMGVYLYNIVTKEVILLTPEHEGAVAQPDIYGDRVVWQDNRSGEWKIYTYLISRPDLGDYLLLDLLGEQVSPAIYENILVYSDHQDVDFATSNIFMYDIAKAELTQITDDEDLSQHKPDIYGNNIVYEDTRNGNLDIYLYNIYTKQETRLTEDPARQGNPSIHKNRVVWEDERNGNKDLYMHHITYWPGSVYENYDWEIFTGEGFREMSSYNDINPAVYEDYIVFQSFRNGSWDIYLYSFINDIFGSTSALIDEANDQINPAIYENRIVWQDERDWNGTSTYQADIWLWERPPGADLGVSFVDYPDSIVTGSVMTYNIVVKNFGDQEATDVTFNQTLPDEIDFIHATDSRSNSFYVNNNTLHCEIGSLLVGETDSISVIVKAIEDGTITTTCELSAVEEDPVPENNSDIAVSIAKWIYPAKVYNGGAPLITSDNQGNAHMAYTNYLGVGWGKLVYATNKTGEWHRDYEVTESNDIKNKSIAIDSDGHVHMIYGTGTYNDLSIMYVNNVSGNWSSPALIKEHTGYCTSLTLHLDSNDKLHISYMKSWMSWDSLFYMNNTNGPWETELLAERSFSMTAFELDENDHVHFVYISANEYLDPPSFKPTYVTKSPEGNWSDPEYIDEDFLVESERFIFDLAIDKNNVPHVVYVGATTDAPEDPGTLNYACKKEGQWTSEILDNRDFSFCYLSITTDKDNNPHLLYANQLNFPETKLIYLRHKNDEWVKQTMEPGDYPIAEIDMCADTLNIIHAVCRENIGELLFVNYYRINASQSLPDIEVIQDAITFEAVTVDSISATQNLTISNVGEKLLSIYEVFISEADSIHFRIANNTCNVLNTSGTCSISVEFNPQSTGYKYARLRIISNDPDHPDIKIPLEGIGVDYHISDYGSLAFGEVETGDSASNVYTIKNEGNTEQQIQSLTIVDDDSSDFYLKGLPVSPINIDALDSIQFEVVFRPVTIGEKTAILRISISETEINRAISGTAIHPNHNIAGTIMLDENTMVTSGRIYVYRSAEDGIHTDLWHKPLNGTGSFILNGIPEGLVTLRFRPDTIAYPEYLNTYLGNTPVYSDADFFYLEKDTSGIEITLVPSPQPPNGSSEISGTFIEEEGSKSGGSLKKGTYQSNGIPVAEVCVFLLDQSSTIIDNDITSTLGKFKFENIPSGQFSFAVDYVGFFMDPGNESLIISGENQKISITAIAEKNVITTNIENTTSNQALTDIKEILVYPNPATDNIILEFGDEITSNEYQLWIHSLTGKVMKEEIIEINEPLQRITIPLTNIPCGMYLIVISNKEESHHLKLIKEQ